MPKQKNKLRFKVQRVPLEPATLPASHRVLRHHPNIVTSTHASSTPAVLRPTPSASNSSSRHAATKKEQTFKNAQDNRHLTERRRRRRRFGERGRQQR
ncbi:hypothetical protein CPC08DRAFT_216173 [Agrocybe pediades]|nr:hypothetical protein CPC08DRAFT_216173 [Agrocybe pediades]